MENALRSSGIKVERYIGNPGAAKSRLDCDVLYYARFTPPLIDRNLVSGFPKDGIPIVVGSHAPLRIDHPVRPTHYIHNIIYPYQIALYHNRFHAYIRTLNTDDLKHAKNIIQRVFYIPQGVDTELFKPLPKKEVFTIYYAARASYNKGTDIFVKIAETLAKHFGNKIAIRINSYGSLTKLYNKLNRYPNVEIKPYLPAEELAKELAQSHVMLFPSRYESFGKLVLEALACGTPVIAFNIRGAVRDIMLKDEVLGRYVIPYCDISAFLSRIVEIYNLWSKRSELYHRLVIRCREIAEQFSWEIVAKRFAYVLYKIYKSSDL